jgi:hypothetical protein
LGVVRSGEILRSLITYFIFIGGKYLSSRANQLTALLPTFLSHPPNIHIIIGFLGIRLCI